MTEPKITIKQQGDGSWGVRTDYGPGYFPGTQIFSSLDAAKAHVDWLLTKVKRQTPS